MLKVYEHPLSPYAQKVKLALYEKKIPFEAILANPLNLEEGTAADFAASSPRLEVPSLVDGDVKIFDSTIILEYIEDKWPEPALRPVSPAARARGRMIEEMCDTYYEAITWGVAEIRFFGRASGAFADELQARASEQIAGANAWLERHLADKPYFDGDRLGLTDVCVQPFVGGAAGLGFAPASGSKLAAWAERMTQRDSVQRCAAAVMEIMSAAAGLEQISKILESGAFKREYRDHRLEWMLRSGGKQIVLDGMSRGNIRFAIQLS